MSEDADSSILKGFGVKFGLSYNTGHYGVDPGKMVTLEKHAEDCGFEAFYVPEHIVLYPGAMAGPMEFPPSLAIADRSNALVS